MQNQTITANTPSSIITKKIGNTVYKIQIHFSKTSKENFNDKLLRIIKNDFTQNVS